VVRNDIDRRRSATPRTVLIRQALIRSGGFTPVVGFGPALPPFRTATTVVDDGLQDTVAAVEIWRVDSPVGGEDPRITLRDASTVTVLSGSAESVIDLADGDVLGERAVVISGDEVVLADAGIALDYAVSDGFRRSEVSVGSTRDNRSQTLRADEAYLQDRRVHDYYPVDPEGRQAVAVFEGGTVTASSSGSDVTALRARSSAAQPWAALDGDPDTAWISGDLEKGVGQWWEVVAESEFTPRWVDVRLVVGEEAGIEPRVVTVSTDAGDVAVSVLPTDQPQRLPVPDGPTRTLRLTLDEVVNDGPGEAFGLREIRIPELDISRAVAAPGLADGGPIVISARKGEQTGCAAVSGQLVCTPQLGRLGEERTGVSRIVDVGNAGTYRVRMWVRPRAGAALDRLLEPALAISPRAAATSVFTSDPANRPQAAVDGVLSTSWLASPLDARPELEIAWGEPRRIRGVRLDLLPDLVASRPLRVTTTVNGRETTDIVSGRGAITVPAQEATSLRLRFDNADVVRSLDPQTGVLTPLPIGVNEVRILGAEDIVKGPRLIDEAGVPCGFGPELSVDGAVALETAVSASVGETLTDELLVASPCDGRVIELSAGRHVIEAQSTAQYAVDSVVLEPVDAPASAGAVQSVEAVEWNATKRTVRIESSAAPRLLETSENLSEGWVASLEGEPLVPVRVDGWRQGWIVPPGSGGTVTMSFAPQPAYVGGLLAGAVAAAVLMASAVIGRRPRIQTAERAMWPGDYSGWILAMGAVVVGALVGGFLGLAAAVLGIAAAAGLGRPLATGLLSTAAACTAATVPWPMGLDAPDWILAITALTAVGALGALAAPRLGRSAGEPSSAPAAPGRTTTR
jgi:arabinofuranan 3-O-arabinosyltransferase